MSVITTGNNPKLLWPGIKAFWGEKYNEHPAEWRELFEELTSEKAYEEMVQMNGFGLAPVKSQGASVAYDTQTQGYTTRFTNILYALGYAVTYEAVQDNQYKTEAMRLAESNAFSMRQTEEVTAANVYNRAFSSDYLGGDGVALISTAHPTSSGNQSNRITTAADFSETALEDLVIQIGQAENDRGLQIRVNPMKLILPVALTFEAKRVLGSELQSGTANNDINALKALGIFKSGSVVNHYLTDADAWFIRTDIPHGMTRFTREATRTQQDNEFNTMNELAFSIMRYSLGWGDWRQLYGSPGA